MFFRFFTPTESTTEHKSDNANFKKFALKKADYEKFKKLFEEINATYPLEITEDYFHNIFLGQVTPDNYVEREEFVLTDLQLALLIKGLKLGCTIGNIRSSFMGQSRFIEHNHKDYPEKNTHFQQETSKLFDSIFGERATLIRRNWESIDPTAINWLYNLPVDKLATFDWLYRCLGERHQKGDKFRARLLPYEFRCIAHLTLYCNNKTSQNLLRMALISSYPPSADFEDRFKKEYFFNEENVNKLLTITDFEDCTALENFHCSASKEKCQTQFEYFLRVCLYKTELKKFFMSPSMQYDLSDFISCMEKNNDSWETVKASLGFDLRFENFILYCTCLNTNVSTLSIFPSVLVNLICDYILPQENTDKFNSKNFKNELEDVCFQSIVDSVESNPNALTSFSLFKLIDVKQTENNAAKSLNLNNA